MNSALLFPQFRRGLVAAFAGACAALSAAFPVLAADDHGHGEARQTAAGGASPRIEAHSDLFELVGVVDKGRMTVYLDRYATNEPVAGARIEYESGQDKGVAVPQADGTYLIEFEALSRRGELPFAFTVSAGAQTDLLAGDLDLEEAHEDHADAGRPWWRWAAYGLAAAAAVLALATLLRRKYSSARAARLD